VATAGLVNAAVKSGTVKCFVFTSSVAVYGAGQVRGVHSSTFQLNLSRF
jgi:nucleoside-diphosphate-sugar epimerase